MADEEVVIGLDPLFPLLSAAGRQALICRVWLTGIRDNIEIYKGFRRRKKWCSEGYNHAMIR